MKGSIGSSHTTVGIPFSFMIFSTSIVPGGADYRLKYPAEALVVSRQRHLDNAFGFPVYACQKAHIPENAVGFRQDSNAEAIFVDDLKAFPRITQLFFDMHVWVAHAAGADHALFALLPERCFQQFGSVDLDLYVFEIMVHVVAFAPAVAVNAAMAAATVYVHPVL